MIRDLQEIVDESYDLFGRYSVSNSLDVCTACCVSPGEMKALLNRRLREILSETLGVWNDAAKSDRPDLREFKHFLPRLLDLVSQFEFCPKAPG